MGWMEGERCGRSVWVVRGECWRSPQGEEARKGKNSAK